MQLVHTSAELADRPATRCPARCAVVMTMGALHDGHLELVDVARERGDSVLVTIFVNPLQFGAGEDLDRYPRTLDADVASCVGAGRRRRLRPRRRGHVPTRRDGDEAPCRCARRATRRCRPPGHFDGVLTVVAHASGLTRPDVAVFGEKDYQQLALIRRMVADLDLPVEIVGVPIVREPDGLAMSSRNRYLDAAQHQAALALSRALQAGADAAGGGATASWRARARFWPGLPRSRWTTSRSLIRRTWGAGARHAKCAHTGSRSHRLHPVDRQCGSCRPSAPNGASD